MLWTAGPPPSLAGLLGLGASLSRETHGSFSCCVQAPNVELSKSGPWDAEALGTVGGQGRVEQDCQGKPGALGARRGGV